MGILRMVIGIPVFVLSLLFAYIGYTEYKLWRYSTPSADIRYSTSTRQCLIAEAAEGSASENDQVLIVRAALREANDRSVDPCWLFTRYTLMRAQSQEDARALVRDAGFVIGKGGWFAAAQSRIALAEKVVDRALKGDFSFAKGEAVDIELKRRQMLDCVAKYIRVWPLNTARTDFDAMRRDMGESFKSPVGTEFFCKKKVSS